MQQFVVPQFIDVESKIIGPITTRQFLILLGATLLIALFYRIFDFLTFLIVGILTLAIAIVFSFVKINGRPFHYFVLNLIQTTKRPGVRVWNHKAILREKQEEIIPVKVDYVAKTKKVYKRSRLAEISLIVDTAGKYKGENQ